MPKGGSVQKKIRDLERSLRKKSADDPAVEKLHLMIASLNAEKKQNIVKIKEKKNSQRYHMVKFFERKKVTRSISKLEKLIEKKSAQGGNCAEELKKKTALEEDLAYIMYFPRALKYVSLFVNNNNNNSNDKKTMLQLTQAKSIALKAWKKSIEAGEEDRVAYAMEVERNGGKSEDGRPRSSERETSEDDNDDIAGRSSDSDEDEEEEGDESNATPGARHYAGQTSTKKSSLTSLPPAGGDSSSSENSSDSDSDSESSGDSSEKEEQEARSQPVKNKVVGSKSNDRVINDKIDDANMERSSSQKMKKEISVATNNISTLVPSTASSYEPDPFFLEEDDGMNTHEISQEIQSSQLRDSRRKAWVSGGSRDRKVGHNSRSVGGAAVAGKALTKQEARLAKWQTKQRDSKDSNNIRSDNTNVAESDWKNRNNFTNKNNNDNYSKSNNKRKFDDNNKPSSGDKKFKAKFDQSGATGAWSTSTTATSTGGNKFSRSSFNNSNAAGFRALPLSSSSTAAKVAPKSAWEEGGGVSAKFSTALTQSKVSGGIITNATNANKKIKFD